jgi:hypothetical protein
MKSYLEEKTGVLDKMVVSASRWTSHHCLWVGHYKKSIAWKDVILKKKSAQASGILR